MSAVTPLGVAGTVEAFPAGALEPAAAALLDAVPVPVVLVGARGDVRHRNESAGRLLGGPARWCDPALLARVLRAGAARTGAAVLSTGLVDAAGRRRDVVATLVQAPDRIGGDGACLLTLAGRPPRQVPAGSHAVAVLAHELRTPLTSLRAALELVGVDEPGDGIDRSVVRDAMLVVAERNAARLHGLLDDLLAADGPALPRQRVRRDRATLADLMDTAVTSVAGSARKRSVLVRRRGGDGEPLWGQEGPLLQVLTNLLANAVRHSPPGTEVVLSGATTADGVELVVEDCGPGIPPDVLPHVFDAYRRGQPDAARDGGHGLGLHVVDQVVRAHDGSVLVRGRAGGGTTAVIHLPQRRSRRPVALDRRVRT